VRTIYDAKIVEIGDGIFAFEITGNGFLYNMVRIIFGTLLKVAYGKMKPEELKSVIDICDRSKAGKTMPAKGLVLKYVEYDDQN
jgi:tRNA pseudouridine38-40 synthase